MAAKRRDGRTIDHQAMEEIRIRAVQQVQAGADPEVVIKALGFHRSCIYEWLAKYRSGGWHALKARKAPGRKPRLSARQIRWIYNALTQKDPRQFKFPFALWTRHIVRALITEKFAITLSLPSIGRLLAQLGLTCQRPLFRAYQQQPSLVENWLKKEFPKIRALAKKDGAEIYFGDEAGLRSDHHSGTTWAPKGQTPVVTSTGARFGLNMISAISPAGALRFMVLNGRVAAEQFCEFLGRLMHGARRPVFLIVDGHPMHRARKVQKRVDEFGGKLRLFFLPPYSPELNPDEYLWNDLKGAVGRTVSHSPVELETHVTEYLRILQDTPEKIRSFFQATETSYAAA